MNERLRASDLALLGAESARTPMHNATLDILDPGDSGFGYEQLYRLVADRIDFVPRYRQRLRPVPGRFKPPVWVDDEEFELGYHLRRSALPSPGSTQQLRELVARIMSRQLDRDRPLWEMYLIEGLAGGRVALFAKSHQVLVDGVSTVDLGQVILDVAPREVGSLHESWSPHGEPGPPRLVAEAVGESLRHPRTLLTGVGGAFAGVVRAAGSVAGAVPGPVGRVSGRGHDPESPLNAALSEQRRFVCVRTDLERYRQVRTVHGGTVNDVLLATVTGGLRAWLLARAESLPGGRQLRAMVPMSVIDEELEPTSLGSQVAGQLLDLPVGEASPVVRLHQVSYALKAHREAGKAVAADRLAGVAGFAPTTFHALGFRVAASEARRDFDLVITNVPGPQFPLYAAGARMEETYPVPPLLPGCALAIGITSYDGAVHFGVNADRDALPDAEILAQCLEDSLDELADSASDTRPRAPRGRTKSAQGSARRRRPGPGGGPG